MQDLLKKVESVKAALKRWDEQIEVFKSAVQEFSQLSEQARALPARQITHADEVLEAIRTFRDGASVSQITRTTRLPIRKVHNTLEILMNGDFVRPNGRGDYVEK